MPIANMPVLPARNPNPDPPLGKTRPRENINKIQRKGLFMFPSLEFILIKDLTIESGLLRQKIKAFSTPLIRFTGEATRFGHMSHQHIGNEAIQ